MSVGVESGFSSDELLNSRFPVHRACRDGDVGALCSLLHDSVDRAELLTEDSFYGWTPIHWAAHFGKLECVLRLVQVGCEVNAVTTRFAQTPAHIAAFGGHPDCILWLLQAGADINRQDYVGETPIHKAARAGSMECISALLISGAKPELRNANGLTAADLAYAQGFHDCARLLSNAENQLKQLNGFGHYAADHSHIQGRSLVNGATNRKRLHEGPEMNHVKKAKIYNLGVEFKGKTLNGTGEEPESMHVESAPDNQSDGTVYTFLSNGHAESNASECRSDMCGSLHLSSSPSSSVAHRPSWASLPSDVGERLHYGHYHGFGDTAEILEETGGRHEHNATVRAEQSYDQEVLSAMQLFHGS